MQLNLDEIQRLAEMKDLKSSSFKRKVKEKVRKQLWDSLLEVYEKEAEKENKSDCQEIAVEELCEWSETSCADGCGSLRAYPQIVQNNPELITMAFTGEYAYGEDSGKEERKVLIASKRKNSSSIKLKVKKNIYKKKTSPGMKSSFLLNKDRKRKKKELMNVKPTKLQKQSSKDDMQTSRQTIHNVSKRSFFESGQGNFKTKTSFPGQSAKNNVLHKCNFKYSMPSAMDNKYVHPSGRVFDCKLVFKICECFESYDIL